MKLTKFAALALGMLLAVGLSSCSGSKYEYETVGNDPLNAKIYTLPNGLKVYMTVNTETPRIQTYIAVRTGGKNDPAETTGLAHYLEHLMFKGTSSFGTQDYAAEKPYLDQITDLYEVYRTKTDPEERKQIYHQIDSISGIAATYAIPNEYDKMMSLIGAKGTNAYTSEDVTCYVEDIPSNQIENWAKVQANRFMDPVFRLFHTELEAVYEEKNIAMTVDIRKELEAIDQSLFPSHPYGKQTVIGTQEHLKNPSLINIRNYFNTWYVPNNVAICLSGDFDPDQMIDIITKYFGEWKASEGVPQYSWPEEKPITESVVREVIGQEAENIILAWRGKGEGTPDGEILDFVGSLLTNGSAGLFDLDLNQAQKVLGAQAFAYTRAESSSLLLYGMPLPGQTLDEVKDLMLAEVAKLRSGDFDEELIHSVLTDLKLSEQKRLEENSGRANMFVESFVDGQPWADAVGRMSRLNSLTKQDIVDFANRYLQDNNYVVVYKRQGDDPNIQRIEKPAITPVEANRDAKSAFLTEIETAVVAPIEPRFVDLEKDLQKGTLDKGQEFLYKKNETNQTFYLMYIFDGGKWADPFIGYAGEYAEYIGTGDMTAEQLAKAFYSLGCSWRIRNDNHRIYVSVSGLDENLDQAVALLDKVLTDIQPDEASYAMYINMVEKSRADSKADQRSIANALRTYVMYGPEYVKAVTPSEAQLRQLKASDLTDRIHALQSRKHMVAYYGPKAEAEVRAIVNSKHQVAETLTDGPANVEYAVQPTPANVVYFAPYTANNSIMTKIANIGEKYNAELNPSVTLFNEYFGGSMNGIVFQEMRETRGLAYSANAWYITPGFLNDPYRFQASITTQNDKLEEAYTHFDEIIENVPQSEAAFQNAKTALQSRLRTERTVRESILTAYLDAKDLGLTEDPNKIIFEKTQNMTLSDLLAFQQQWVNGRKYSVALVSDPKQVDLKFFRTIGEVKTLKLEEIFGY
ncbi:MAG: insulinase family protein [Bacteroidales bacterium]|nr:insulinase family protein [Bacteroidales bacterium]